MKGFILGVIASVIALIVGVYIVFSSGVLPVATSAQAMPFEKKLANMAQHSRITKEMPKSVPMEPDEPNLLAGAKLYVDDCAACHSLPGQPETSFAKGMFPKPPHLFKGKGVTDDPAGESYWKVANGIRLTGMPAFKGALSDTQMWQVSLLLANADKLSPAVKAVLTTPPPPTMSMKQ
jgi:thiosulfate dehydrogenase